MTIKKQVRLAIKLAAKNATQGEWRYGRSGFNSIVQAPVVLPRGGSSNVVICKLFRSEWRGELKAAHDAAFIAAANPITVLALLADLDAAEKRIAELEAREVDLPKRSVGEVMHMSGFAREYAEGWCSGNDNAIHEIRAAGISIKGE